MFASIAGLMKPCYLFAPSTLLRRLSLRFTWPETPTAEVDLPWGMRIGVDLRDAIGSEIFKQRIFDLAVSECAWRLLAEGDRVIDAGANIGYMTLLAAGKVGRSGLVHSFEPHPAVSHALEANVARNRTSDEGLPVVVHRSALGSSAGEATLFESDYFAINFGTASIANVPAAADAERSTRHIVTVERLDDLFPAESFALLKIDVEGFEAEVLEGARELLGSGRVRDVIYEDHSLGQTGLAATLSNHGFTIYAIGHSAFGPALLPAAEANHAVDSSWESASFLATRDPSRAATAMRGKGWRVLRGA
jgi:FkbM family methyltransferase